MPREAEGKETDGGPQKGSKRRNKCEKEGAGVEKYLQIVSADMIGGVCVQY
jgi:hypothetical protein